MSSLTLASRPFSKALGLGALFAALSTAALAQVAITDVDYTPITNGANTVINNYTPGVNFTFGNDSASVTNFVSDIGSLPVMGVTGAEVYLRRTGTPGTQSSTILLQSNGVNSTYSSTLTTVDSLLESQNNFAGISNPFLNGAGAANVERIDVYFGAGGHAVTVNEGMVFFDLNLEAGDTFRIAAITGWSAGAPTAYANTGLAVYSTDFSQVPLQTADGLNSADYYSATFNSGDTISGSPTSLTNLSGQTLWGVFVRFEDLGLSPNQTIYGISLMAGDVNPGLASDLVNYNNSVIYNNNTNSSWGTVDFVNFNTAIASPVPEPSTYGALLTAGTLGFFALRRRRLAKHAAAKA